MKKIFNPCGARRAPETDVDRLQGRCDALAARLASEVVRSNRFETALKDISEQAEVVTSPNGTTRKLARLANVALAV